MPESRAENKGIEEMQHREITLTDGRYMIFYTFGGDDLEETSEPEEDV